MNRILGIIVGLAALAIGAFAIFGALNPGLPTCDSADTDKLLRQLVMTAAAEEPAVKGAADKDAVSKSIRFSGIKEVSHDKEKEVRECSGVVDLVVGAEKIVDAQAFYYRITWEDKGEGKFFVQLHAEGK